MMSNSKSNADLPPYVHNNGQKSNANISNQEVKPNDKYDNVPNYMKPKNKSLDQSKVGSASRSVSQISQKSNEN